MSRARAAKFTATISATIAVLATAAATGAAVADQPASLVGKYHTHFHTEVRVNLRGGADNHRTWIVKKACGAERCRLRLLFELSQGGYEKFTLSRRNNVWTGVRRGLGPYCRKEGRYVGSGVERVTIRATATDRVDGRRRVTKIEGYYRADLQGQCPGQAFSVGHEVRHVFGRRAE